jgi:succinate dehydrogenase/fumarate reductase flavoprotein subunit
MKLKEAEYISSDVLVIGGGGAGLRAAIAAHQKGASVLIISKSRVGLGNNTAMAKGAFAAATGEANMNDSPDIHLQDTLNGGRLINDIRLLKKVTGRIVDEVSFLEKCGVPFWKDGQKFYIGDAPGHSYARNYYAEKQRGTNFTLPLKNFALKSGVRVIEGIFISRLLIRDGVFIGAVGLDNKAGFFVFRAKTVVIATGGLGQAYLNTDNAAGITGNGYALAFYSGLLLRDMEFVQFYPAALRGKRIIVYEIFLSNLGGILRNSKGENVLAKYGLEDPLIMTRDRVTRACMREILDGNDIAEGMVMDLNSVTEDNMKRFRHLLPVNTPQYKREFVVLPTVHFFMGGIVTDEEASTSVDGVFACGEVVGGVHGANRIAANALSEVFAMGGVAGENAAALAGDKSIGKSDLVGVAAEKIRLESLFGEEKVKLSDLIRTLKETSWYQAGIIRSQAGLERGLERIREICFQAGEAGARDAKSLIKRLELDNMLLVTEAISRAALKRTESRGAHYREDYPEENSDWRVNIFVSNHNGKIDLEKRPVERQTGL